MPHHALNILLAEGDRELAEGLQRILRTQGHQVHLVQECVDIDATHGGKPIDLLLIDPFAHLDGQPVWDWVTRWSLNERSHMIAFCDEADLPAATHSHARGHVDTLSKPFRIPELLARIRWVQRCVELTEQLESHRDGKHTPGDNADGHVSAPTTPSERLRGESLASSLTACELDHILELQKAMTKQFKEIRIELEARTEEAEIANRAKTAFLASISHELRTPLNSILGFAQTLEQKVERGRLEDLPLFTQRILSSGHHLLRLIDDLLDWSRFQADGIELRLSQINLVSLVEQAVQHVSPQIEERNILFCLDADQVIPAVQGDALRLVQVLINLLSNSVKFTPSGGKIGISIEPDDQTVTVTAWDTGCGIPEDQHRRIFERFERGDPGESVSGWGLGLAVSREIINLHHGKIWADENPGGGTRIRFTLPVRQTILEPID